MEPHHPVVLVVDDHDDQRDLLAAALELHGHTVRGSKGAEALQRLDATPVSCLVIDEYLSRGLRGSSLVAQARMTNPNLCVVLTSSLELRPDQLPAATAYLLKPYHVADLVSAVKHCAWTLASGND